MTKLQKIISGIVGVIILVGVISVPFLSKTNNSSLNLGNIGTGWHATSTTQGWISPTPINGISQTPVANQFRASFFTSTSTSLNVFPYASSTVLTSRTLYSEDLNGIFYVPKDFTTNGCVGSSTTYAKTFQGCVRAMYDLASARGALGAQVIVPFSISETQWTDTIFADINGVALSISCTPGVQLKFGGSKGLTGVAVKVNFGNPTAHWPVAWRDCQYLGQTTLIAAAQANTSLNYGIDLGGSQGAVGLLFEGNTFNGFGTDVRIGQNAYMLTFIKNAFTGGNGTTTARGSLLHINVASNSGEANNFISNTFTDPGNSIADNAIYITSAGTASNVFWGGSMDNAQLYCGASNGICKLDGVHIENPGSPNSYAVYIPIINPSSDGSTSIILDGVEFANSASNWTWETLVKHGGQFSSFGSRLDNYNGFTVTNFVDHSNNNGQSSDLVCQTQVQGGALTNLVAGGGGLTWSLTNGVACSMNRSNSYTIGLRPVVSNTNEFYSGNSVVGTFDHSGNWALGEAVSTSLVTIRTRLTAQTSIGAATTTVTYPLESFSSSAPQFALSAGGGLAKWAFRNAGGSLYLSTTTVAGNATSSMSALSILSTGQIEMAKAGGIAAQPLLNIGPGTGDTSHTVDIWQPHPTVQNVLSLNQTTAGFNNFLQFQPAGANSATNVNWIMGTNASSNHYSFSMWNGTSVVQRLTLLNTGELGLGTTTPHRVAQMTIATTTTPQLALSAGAGIRSWTFRNAGGNLYIATTTTDGTATSTNAALTIDSNSQVFLPAIAVNITGNSACVTTGKQLTDAGAASCIPSSIRYKENLSSFSNALGMIEKINVKNFDYKEGYYDLKEGRKSFGVIAEDLEKIDKRLVDYGNDGKPQSVHFDRLSALVLAGVKELDEKINNLPQYTQKTTKSFTDNWQWLVMGIMFLWIIRLEVKNRKKHAI